MEIMSLHISGGRNIFFFSSSSSPSICSPQRHQILCTFSCSVPNIYHTWDSTRMFYLSKTELFLPQPPYFFRTLFSNPFPSTKSSDTPCFSYNNPSSKVFNAKSTISLPLFSSPQEPLFCLHHDIQSIDLFTFSTCSSPSLPSSTFNLDSIVHHSL